MAWSGQVSRVWQVPKENKHCFFMSWFVENVVCFLCGVGTALGFSFWGAERLMTKSCQAEALSSRRAGREKLVLEVEHVCTLLKKQ